MVGSQAAPVLRNALRCPLNAGSSNVDWRRIGTVAPYRDVGLRGSGCGAAEAPGEGEGKGTDAANSNTLSVIDCWSENSPDDCPLSIASWRAAARSSASEARKASTQVAQLPRPVGVGPVVQALPLWPMTRPRPPQAIQFAGVTSAPLPIATTKVFTLL